MQRTIRNERGIMMPFIILLMSAILAATAVGVGFGRMTLISTEAQNAADVAALAGAVAVFKNRDPIVEAHLALFDNRVDNRIPNLMLDELLVGTYSFESRVFEENGLIDNAVFARVSTPFENPFGALIGRGSQVVEKIAYASFTGLRGGRPTLPIVVGDCHFDQDCTNNQCMPRLTQAPDPSDNSGWTGFFEGANTPTVESYMPSPCGDGNVQEIWIGDEINVTNGQATPLLRAVDCLIDEGMLEHLIPIVPCGGHYNQTKEVLGFATIVLESVKSSGSKKGIDLHAIFKSDAIGAIGGHLYGTGNVALVPVSGGGAAGAGQAVN